MSNILIGNEVLSGEKRGQVYHLTHDGEGQSFPHVSRAFISFSYGGKNIEDFGLIVSMGDKLNRQVYAEFEDETSSYETLDGQYYWGTHSKENKINFTLSTDGMTQEELDSFAAWFKPGVERELILSEHPNRAIKARISTMPSISMIPFKTYKQYVFSPGAKPVSVPTILYKGDIDLALVMDDPYWYGLKSFYPHFNPSELPSQDVLKSSLEDHIPFQNNLPAGNPDIAGGVDWSSIIAIDESSSGKPIIVSKNIILAVINAAEEKPEIPVVLGQMGIINETLDDAEIPSIPEINENIHAYIYYAGNAPSKPIINFTLENSFDENGKIVFSETGYPWIKVGDSAIFYYTFPAIYLNYNKIIDKLNDIEGEFDIFELKEYFRDNIKEKHTRNRILTFIEGKIDSSNNGRIGNYALFVQQAKTYLAGLLKINSTTNKISASFSFNSKTGEATGIFLINVNGDYQPIEQNVGDMVRSKYLIIDQRCNFEINRKLEIQDCLLVDSSEALKDFSIIFKNMYL